MKPIGTIVCKVLDGYGLTDNIICEKLKKDWVKIFKEPLSSHMEPHKFINGELLIIVDSHIWLNEINFLKDSIIEKLSPYGVKNIIFKFGRIFRKEDSKSKTDSIKKKLYKPSILSKEEISFIEDIISKIEDKDLRSVIKNTITKSILIKKGNF
jgi:hypothetical protein